MDDTTYTNDDGLPRWVPLAAGLALAVLLLSGAGILLLRRFGEGPPTPDAPPPTATTTADAPTRTPDSGITPPVNPANPTPLTPGSLTFNTRQPAALTATEAVQRHTVMVGPNSVGDLIIIEAAPTFGSPAMLDLRLLDPNGRIIAVDQMPASDSLGWLRTDLPSAGMYTIEVYATSDLHLGAYTITAQLGGVNIVPPWQTLDETAWQPQPPITLAVGESRRRTMLRTAQADQWLLPVEAVGQRLRITVEGDVTLTADLPGLARRLAQPTEREEVSTFTFETTSPEAVPLRVTPRGPVGDGLSYTLSVEELPPGEPFTVRRGPLRPGTNQGRLTSADQHDAWLFSGQAGQTVVLELDASSNALLDTQSLKGPDGEVITPATYSRSAEARSFATYTLPTDGTYTYTVESVGTTWTSYTVDLRRVEGEFIIDRPDELTLTTNIRTTLPAGVEEHAYAFEVRAGQRYAITADNLSFPWPLTLTLNRERDGQIRDRLGRAESLSDGTARLVFTADGSETLTVRVSRINDTLPLTYTLRAEQADPFEPVELGFDAFSRVYEGVLRPGGSEVGELTRADHAHDYLIRHDESTAQTLTVTVEGRRGMVPCLLGPSDWACLNDSAFWPGSTIISVRPGELKRLRVAPLYGQVGTYTISVSQGHPPLVIPEGAVEAQYGVEMPPNPAGYVIPGEEGERVWFIVRPTAPDFGLRASGRLYHPSGDNTPLSVDPNMPSFRLPETGKHFLNLHTMNDSYTVEFTKEQPDIVTMEGVLTLTQQAVDSLSHGWQEDVWELDVEPGQQVTVRLEAFSNTTITFPVSIFVRGTADDPSDSIIYGFSTNQAGVTFTAQEGLTYTVIVRARGEYNSRGNSLVFPPPIDYRLRIMEGRGFTPVDTRTLQPGQRAEGQLRLPYDAGLWLLDVVEDDVVTLTLPSAAYQVEVFNAEGLSTRNLTDEEDLPGVYRFRAGRSGLYAVYVYRPDGGVGFYTITAEIESE